MQATRGISRSSAPVRVYLHLTVSAKQLLEGRTSQWGQADR